ncbi:transmembrane emp24 domain-containing protein p24beta3-like [Hibiscus syriacus]|uniref:Transmembrane emp24 domain-containing protein p24beta3-like n=1 Tax=Hibiscus syriacus TaxID=106335 RepID=A0A6A3BEJ0_HIBSY|nr:transmembrane emp24 domain-containing protein p24beta3-like [Hibiscus syriacus]
MLAVFEKSITKSPDALNVPGDSGADSALNNGFLAAHFTSIHPGSVTVNLGSLGFMAYSLEKKNPLLPRIFVVVGPYPPDQVVRDIQGKFAFVIYYSFSKATFIASDADGSVPFFWGTDVEGHLVLADDTETIKKVCRKSFAPFPKGCFFTSPGGLRSYEHPLNELKPVPRVDSSGHVCGATFSVDVEANKESTGMEKSRKCCRLVCKLLSIETSPTRHNACYW